MVRICHHDYMWGGLLENGRDPPLSCGSEHSEEVAVVTVLPDSQIAPPHTHRCEAGLSQSFPLA